MATLVTMRITDIFTKYISLLALFKYTKKIQIGIKFSEEVETIIIVNK